MPPSLLNRGFVHRQLEKVEQHLDRVREDGVLTHAGERLTPQMVRELRTAVRDAREQESRSPEPHYHFSRSPIVSLFQSALHDRLADKVARGEVVHTDERMGDPFTVRDIGWVVNIVASYLWQALHGRHDFVDTPAQAALADRARLVVFGDWGTGMRDARNVADQAARFVEGDCVHVVHLGDTYYSGTEDEARRNVLALWPVADGGAAGSWALNGNHDMYSGGHGYFETTLGDPRFAGQRVDGRPTSWFTLTSPSWNVVGLDTAWQAPLLEWGEGRLQVPGGLGYLHGSQAEHVARCAADPARRLLVLSHHQLFTVYDDDQDVGTPIAEKLDPLMGGHRIDVWLWGHEHDCLAYEPNGYVRAARAIGHAAVPVVLPDEPGRYIDRDRGLFLPSDQKAGAPRLEWVYRAADEGPDGTRWQRHGFAVVDLDRDSVRIRYVDEYGNEYSDETIAPGR